MKIKLKQNPNSIYKPVKIRPSSLRDLKSFASATRAHIVDTYPEQMEELFLLKHPQYRFNKNYLDHFEQFYKDHINVKKSYEVGSWFYFPWLNSIVHYLDEDWHQELRTGRNRLLITQEEQYKYYKSRIGILGMSVGSHVALTIVMTGGGKYLKLADPDTISGSNLNRIRTGLQNVGIKKVIVVARQIYEINPYSVLEVYSDGLTDQNINQFFSSNKKLDLLVEEMDNPFYKIKVRQIAKKQKIPVIMAADNDDGIIVDVERFDKNNKLPILHGLLGRLKAEDFKSIPLQDLPRVMARIAGANLSTLRMIESVSEVGKTIYSWPQLGNAATLCGSVLAYLSKSIILGKNIKSGRTSVSIQNYFEKPSKSEKNKRDKLLKQIGVYS